MWKNISILTIKEPSKESMYFFFFFFGEKDQCSFNLRFYFKKLCLESWEFFLHSISERENFEHKFLLWKTLDNITKSEGSQWEFFDG